MIAWVWPESTVRSTPLRISLGPSSVATETCRSLISNVDMKLRSDARSGEFGLDGRLQPLPQLGDGDLAEDLAEEPADDEPARDVLRDAAALQVEQLLVVEAAGRARVARARDLAGLDLQVRHRVGPGPGGEDEVAVELEGVGGLGRVADQHVADPHGAGAVALQGVLVVDARAAVRLAVVDEQPLLQVLTRVGEAQARELG